MALTKLNQALVFSMLIVRTRTRSQAQDSSTIQLSTTFRFWNTSSQPPDTRDRVELGHPHGSHIDTYSDNSTAREGSSASNSWQVKNPHERTYEHT